MTTTIRYERTLAATTRPVALRVVRYDAQVGIPGRHAQRPAWSQLYAIVFLALVALLATDFLLPEGIARSLAELLATFGCIGLTRLWISANRWSLSRITERQPEEGESEADALSDREVG